MTHPHALSAHGTSAYTCRWFCTRTVHRKSLQIGQGVEQECLVISLIVSSSLEHLQTLQGFQNFHHCMFENFPVLIFIHISLDFPLYECCLLPEHYWKDLLEEHYMFAVEQHHAFENLVDNHFLAPPN